MNLPPPFYARLYNFRQADFAGQPLDVAWIDSELDRLLVSVNQTVATLRGITDAQGRLILQQPLREMKLIETLQFVATAGQTVFYLSPITDPLTAQVEFRIQVGTSLYQSLDMLAVTLAAATATGSVTATRYAQTYNFTDAVPTPCIGAELTINGTYAGRVTSQPTATSVITDTPWPNATVTATVSQWAWSFLTKATISITPALTAGQKVQALIYGDGAGALTQLGTAGPTTGAIQVAIADAQGIIYADNVEDALQEIQQNILTLQDNIGPIADYARLDGSMPYTGPLSMGGQNIINMKPGSQPGHAVEYSQFEAFVGIWNNLQQFYMKLDGTSSMAGPLNFGAKQGKNLADGTDPQDAVTVTQLNSRVSSTGSTPLTGDLNMNSHKITSIAAAVADGDVPSFGQVKALLGAVPVLAGYATPGVVSYVVPAGVQSIKVRGWGGGGGGSVVADWNATTGGGGAGGYVEAIIAVNATPPDTLILTVGAAGSPGVAGGLTKIERGSTVLLQAAGGAAGHAYSSSGADTGIGGAASSPAGIPCLAVAGGDGQMGWENTASGNPSIKRYGGAGGSACNGGAGGRGSALDLEPIATPGVWPGGGGAAAHAGAAGGIVLEI
jgi:hypothetical protein